MGTLGGPGGSDFGQTGCTGVKMGMAINLSPMNSYNWVLKLWSQSSPPLHALCLCVQNLILYFRIIDVQFANIYSLLQSSFLIFHAQISSSYILLRATYMIIFSNHHQNRFGHLLKNKTDHIRVCEILIFNQLICCPFPLYFLNEKLVEPKIEILFS